MANFITLTFKDGNKKCAVNLDNVAEIYELNGATIVRYCSGGDEGNLCSFFSETFEEISKKVTNALHQK